MNEKLLKTFGEDLFFFSDEYFQKASTIRKIKKCNTSKEELLALQREDLLSFFHNRVDKVIANKEKPELTFCVDYQGLLYCVYDPDYDYLAAVVSIFEELLKQENEEYLNHLILSEPGYFYGGSCHNDVLPAFAVDYKYFWRPDSQYGPRQIVATDRRFSGLLPFLFQNKYTDLYNRFFDFCLFVFKKLPRNTGRLALSILNFLKKHDQDKYIIFKKEFDEIVEKDKAFWKGSLDIVQYGHGYFAQNEYCKTLFLDALE